MEWDNDLADERFKRRDARVLMVGVLCLKGPIRRSIFLGLWVIWVGF